jgi:hypothetical protein
MQERQRIVPAAEREDLASHGERVTKRGQVATEGKLCGQVAAVSALQLVADVRYKSGRGDRTWKLNGDSESSVV